MKQTFLKNSTSILIFAAVVLLALFLVFRGLLNTYSTSVSQPPISNSVYKLIEVNNDSQIPCGTKQCSLPNGWKINTIIANSLPNGVACTLEPCTVFSVTNGKHEFFFSNQELKDTSASSDAFTSKTYNLNPETVLTALYYKQFLEEGGKLREVDSRDIKEMYGCLDSFLCVTTGIIKPNTAVELFSEFTKLLNGIEIN